MLSLIRMLPIGAQAAIGVAAFAAIVGGGTAVYTHIYNKGYAAAINKIAAQDQEAVNAANEARNRVRRCRDAGGVWDSAAGVCVGR